MMAKNLLVLCASTLIVKFAFSQCLARETLTGFGLAGPFGAGWGYDGFGPFDGLGYGGAWGGGIGPLGPGLSGMASANGLAASYGGGVAITSASPITPTGLTVTSENAIEGTVIVSGQLPFLGAVATDGAFPSMGVGSVVYSCGDGAIGITAEGPVGPAPIAPAPCLGYGPALAGYNGYAGRVGHGRYGGIY